MTIALAIVSIVAFAILFRVLAVVPSVNRSLATMRGAVAIMNDAALDELAKEQAVQKASLSMLSHVGAIGLRVGGAILGAFSPIWIADVAGLASLHDVLDRLVSWPFILAATVALTAAEFGFRRAWPR